MWHDAAGYESYIGRWSKIMSEQFIDWLAPRQGLKWLELGCGTGALTRKIADKCAPSYLLAVDNSENYLEEAIKNAGANPDVHFQNADLAVCNFNDQFDHITSGLLLNFLSDVEGLLSRVLNNLKPGGQLSSFVWDYGGHYQPMRNFWEAARKVTPIAESFDAGTKFKLCREENLVGLFNWLGLQGVQFEGIERIATFRDFDDYWLPLVAAQGSVSAFMAALTPTEKDLLRDDLKQRLPIAYDGEIKMVIRVLAIQGTKR